MPAEAAKAAAPAPAPAVPAEQGKEAPEKPGATEPTSEKPADISAAPAAEAAEADAPALTQPAAPAPETTPTGEHVAANASLAPHAAEDPGEGAAARAGLRESAETPEAKRAKRDPAVPAEGNKPKDAIEVEAPRANAA